MDTHGDSDFLNSLRVILLVLDFINPLSFLILIIDLLISVRRPLGVPFTPPSSGMTGGLISTSFFQVT